MAIHPDLRAQLFAAEPMMYSPSNIDIDHRGRVWVCEIINYRGHNGKRSEGDRILILEDTNEDGQADRSKVFYQGRDIDSPHGVCVLGNQVIVSAGSQVVCFTDSDGDDRPDKKDVWFTGIHGVQHDHGIHAFLFGPDGKLYFNFGNAGEQLQDPDGKPIIDLDGKEVAEHRQPYQQGMVFRCNLDRSQFETLAWNFRNNWMVTVDSFGTIWQSDNDDDGNRGVRINYVMPFGNYGYQDERTGAGWQSPRTGMSNDPVARQWHLDDPGVVPNLLNTGAGSPTGILVYEGTALPELFRSQLIHCDAGPSVTRAYRVTNQGAGYSAEIVNLLQGERDVWFRPSDVKMAPDGSLIVADWYDPGVGGHQMGDLDRGRLFRITSRTGEAKYRVPQYDLSTTAGATAALRNPNNSVRYLAWKALEKFGTAAVADLEKLRASDDPVSRARAYWALGKLSGRGADYVALAAKDRDERIRCLALRLSQQLPNVDPLAWAQSLSGDHSAHVRRECAVALRHRHDPRVAEIWNTLAATYDGTDRWYLEALGIGADGQWDAVMEPWWKRRKQPVLIERAERDIVWRSRATQSPQWLAKLITEPATPEEELPRYFRAFDFLTGPERDAALQQLAEINFDFMPSLQSRRPLMISESLQRLDRHAITNDPARLREVSQLAQQVTDMGRRIQIIDRFELSDHYEALWQWATTHTDDSYAIDAVRLLLSHGQGDKVEQTLTTSSPEQRLALIGLLRQSSDNRAVPLLMHHGERGDLSSDERRAVIGALANIRAGAEYLVQQAEAAKWGPDTLQAVAASLQHAPWHDLRERALKVLPPIPSKDNRPLPPLNELVQRSGDASRGEVLFRTTGTCAKCHVVKQQGKAVGPELSEIGRKLSREAMLESIVYPSAGISHSFELYTAELKDGNVVSGISVSQSDSAVELKDQEGVVHRLARGDLEQLVKQPISLMPANLHQQLTEQELIDLVDYLLTLK